MIEIRITDPANEAPDTLRAVANLLAGFADAQGNLPARAAHLQRAEAGVRAAVAAIGKDDNPATGVDASEVFAGGADPQTVFAGGADPQTVFAGGADPAQVFAQNPNAQAATLPTASVAAAVASAPAQNINPAPVQNGSTLELDSEGLPWDGRIHASTRSKIQAGTWKVKRGVDDAAIAQVKAELRAVLGNTPAPSAVNVTTPTDGAAYLAASAQPDVSNPPQPAVNPGNVPPPPPPAPPSGIPAAPAATPIAQATAPQAATPAPNAPAPSASISFPQLCGRITSALTSGELTQERLGQVLQANNLQGLPTLAAFPQLVPTVAAALGFA